MLFMSYEQAARFISQSQFPTVENFSFFEYISLTFIFRTVYVIMYSQIV